MGQGPRTVTYQKSSHLSKFSATPTLLNKIDDSLKLLRWVPRWDGHPAGVLEFLLFNRLGRWTTGRRLFTVYWLHSVFLRSNFRTWQCIHNVSMIQMNITPELVNQGQFSRLKIRTFATKISVYWVPYKAIVLLWKRSFHQDCLQTTLAIMWKMFPCERSFSNWKWSISSTSPPSIFVKTKKWTYAKPFSIA